MRIFFQTLLHADPATDAPSRIRIGVKRSAILAAFLLAACGQRGALYLPKVPPLPPPPDMQTGAAPSATPSSNAPASGASAQ